MAEKDKIFYWLKLKSEFMNGEIVDFLMSQKNGANYVVLYQMLCIKTINTKGELATQLGDILVPYNVEKIQRDLKWFDIDTVRVALELYKKLGLVYVQENGIIKISNFEEIVGSETYWAKVKRQQKIKEGDFDFIKKISHEQFMLPNGERKFIDEKRYGGNGMLVWDRAKGKCEICGSTENLCLHHNNGYSNEYEDLVLVCRSCHRDIEEGKINWKFSNKSPTDVQNPLISNIYTLISNIFNYWNTKNIIVHRELSDTIYKAIEKALKKYSEEEIKTYIDRYDTVIKDETYFWSYKWSLKTFLTQGNGISCFTDEGETWVNYCAEIEKKGANNAPQHSVTTEKDQSDLDEIFGKVMANGCNGNSN